jgi:hypothetical protein
MVLHTKVDGVPHHCVSAVVAVCLVQELACSALPQRLHCPRPPLLVTLLARAFTLRTELSGWWWCRGARTPPPHGGVRGAGHARMPRTPLPQPRAGDSKLPV